MPKYVASYNPTLSDGEFKCACCEQPITYERSLLFKFDGVHEKYAYYTIGEEEDIEGYYLHSFCKYCTPRVVDLTPEQAYNLYPGVM